MSTGRISSISLRLSRVALNSIHRSKLCSTHLLNRCANYHESKIVSNFSYCGKPIVQLSKNARRHFSSYPAHRVVPMPALSPTMETGSIAKWLLKEGDKFEAGVAICEVETDKATVTYEATEDGYIARILVGSGEVKVGQPLMITVDEQSDISAFASYTLADATSSASPAAPKPSTTPVSAPPPTPAVTSATPVVSTPISTPTPQSNTSSDRIFASPYAKKLARESGIPIQAIKGSGPKGRVIAEDVLLAQKTGVQISSPTTVTTTAPVSAPAVPVSAVPLKVSTGGIPGIYQDFEVSDLALAVANRQVWAKANVPHYYLSVDINLDKVLKLRESLNKNGEDKDTKLGVIDFIVKASALAMRKVPDVNGSWMDTFVRRYNQVDINVVTESSKGLITPVIKDVGGQGLKSIAKELESIEASADSLDISKLQLGTFSIHDLGKYGIKSAAPIVISPQACALAIGTITDTVIPNDKPASAEEENWKIAPIVTVTLSCDHRVVDGAVGAQWLAALKGHLEEPMTMLL